MSRINRRSCLFVPSSNPGMLQSANIYECDSVIFDLEDSVILNEKDSALELLKNFLNTFAFKKEIIVRINGMDTPFWKNDLKEIVSDKIDAIMLPKATVDDLINLDKYLTEFENLNSIKKRILIIPIVELAISLLQIEKIVSLPRVDGVLLGAEDFTKDMEVIRTEIGTEIEYPRSRIAVACHAYKIDAIDTPFTNVNSEEGLINDSKHAKQLGMNAKACIHPNQIPIINEIFSPSEKEILFAKRVMEAFRVSTKGAFSLDGKMIDKPIIDRSKKILEKAKGFDLL